MAAIDEQKSLYKKVKSARANSLTSRQEGNSGGRSQPGCRASVREDRAKETPTEKPGGTWSTSSPRARHPSHQETRTPLGECETANRAVNTGLSADAARLAPSLQHASCVHAHPSSNQSVGHATASFLLGRACLAARAQGELHPSRHTMNIKSGQNYAKTTKRSRTFRLWWETCSSLQFRARPWKCHGSR